MSYEMEKKNMVQEHNNFENLEDELRTKTDIMQFDYYNCILEEAVKKIKFDCFISHIKFKLSN